MLGHRSRRWLNISSTMGRCLGTVSAFITPPTTRLKQPRWSDKHNVHLMLVHRLRRWPNIYNVACVCLGLAYWFAWSIPYRVNITFMENHAFSSVQHYILGGWSKPLLKNTRPHVTP